MSKYTILDNGMGDFLVKEKTRTHTGVRWITLENTIDSFDSLEKAKVSDLGEQFWDNLSARENAPSMQKGKMKNFILTLTWLYIKYGRSKRITRIRKGKL